MHFQKKKFKFYIDKKKLPLKSILKGRWRNLKGVRIINWITVNHLFYFVNYNEIIASEFDFI